jgi:hypothetical protein
VCKIGTIIIVTYSSGMKPLSLLNRVESSAKDSKLLKVEVERRGGLKSSNEDMEDSSTSKGYAAVSTLFLREFLSASIEVIRSKNENEMK